MSTESTTPAQCTDAEYQAAKQAGLLFTEQGTNEFDAAVHRFARAIEQAVLQSPEMQALRKDAERYRHTIKSESDGAVDICVCHINWLTGDRVVLTGNEANNAIDAAMEQQT